MSGPGDAFRPAYTAGLALCLGLPPLAALLLLTGAIPAGDQPPEGLVQQVGYQLTGLVFLAAAIVFSRRTRAFARLAALPPADRPAAARRECLMVASLLQVGVCCGLAYWAMVGTHAPRHAWGFLLTTPMLYVALVPRPARWAKASEG